MILSVLVGLACVMAFGPAVLFLINLFLYRRLPSASGTGKPAISVLVPARNEEGSIRAAVEAALANQDIELEVVVIDDHSEDATASIVEAIQERDPRVRLERAPPLPVGWCGKQHACAVLAERASHDLLVFVDADVRLAPDSLARMAAFLDRSGASLLSGIPYQETGTALERLLIPLIHFILLGFLPLIGLRGTRHPAFAAGCGQLFLVRRADYRRAGGHAAIRATLHDGIQLPRAFRLAGLKTELFDATDAATCRMYRGAREVWRGLAKNATEGLAAPARIGPFTLLLFGGQVLPWLLLAGAEWLSPGQWAWTGAALLASTLPRWIGVVRFRQSVLGASLHPISILILLAIQWYALGRAALGAPQPGKGGFTPLPLPEWGLILFHASTLRQIASGIAWMGEFAILCDRA